MQKFASPTFTARSPSSHTYIPQVSTYKLPKFTASWSVFEEMPSQISGTHKYTGIWAENSRILSDRLSSSHSV